MELLDAERSAVVIIDLQGRLMETIVRPRLVVEGTVRLLKLAELFRVPVVMTEQYPKGLGGTHPEVRAAYDALSVPRLLVEKTSFSSCGEPAFLAALNQLLPTVPAGHRQLVVAGIEAHVCVMQTVIELMQQGSQVHLCWECVSSRGEEYRRYALDRMAQAGAVLTNHESVAFEWARDKNHPAFRALSALLKEGQPG
jgi:nicotinamidase-related amidase